MRRRTLPSFRTAFAAFSAALLIAFAAREVRAQFAPPVVTVYSLVPNGAVASSWGPRLAGAVAASLASQGGVTVKSPPGDVAQADYLNAALRLGADYYVSGYVSPSRDEVTVVLQLVSTRSGTLLWTTTAQLQTPDDVSAPATNLHKALLDHAGRGLANVATPRPAPTAVPSAAVSRSAAPAPAAAVPPPAPPAAADAGAAVRGRPIGMLDATGAAGRNENAYIAGALALALSKAGYYVERRGGREVENLNLVGNLVCSDVKLPVVMTAKVRIVDSAPEAFGWISSSLDVTAYDCDAKRVLEQFSAESGGNSWKAAVDKVVAAAAKSYADPGGPAK